MNVVYIFGCENIAAVYENVFIQPETLIFARHSSVQFVNHLFLHTWVCLI